MTQPLAYEPPVQPKPTMWLHYIALACGVVPLAFGAIDFALFLIMRDDRFALIGLLIIIGGCCLAFVGVVCALVYLYQAKKAAQDERDRARRLGLCDIAVILINFPVALLMSLIGSMMLPEL